MSRVIAPNLRAALLASFVFSVFAGCSDEGESSSSSSGGASSSSASASGGGGAGGESTGGTGGAGAGGAVPVDKAMDCASTFGDALTDDFGRLDGTVLAIVAPDDAQCALVNDDHLVIQVLMNQAVYRMVVNIDDVAYASTSAALIGPPWAEGWHTDVALEYPTDLDVHSEVFEQLPLTAMVETISEGIELGAQISVYAVSSGGEFASSAHLIHRNDDGPDGAILLNPTSESPTYLVFRFANQSF